MILIIRGPLGIGKTTVARLLCQRLNALYLSVDEILDENGLDRGSNGIPARNFWRANELSLPAAREALEAGRGVVYDGNFYYISQIRHLLRRLPGSAYVFTLQAPLEVCIARDAGRAHVYGVDSTSWVFFLAGRVKEGIPVETAGRTALEVVEEIEAVLRAAP